MSVCLFLAAFTALSLGVSLWQVAVALGFPVHRRHPAKASLPGVTLLKPLKGCDATTRASLESWMTQGHSAPVQVLFGVRDASDPVCGLVRELMAAHPGVDAELVLCPELLGANAKVSTLAHLEQRIRHEVVVVSDADVRVPADFLGQFLTSLARPGVGLVNCFYRLANPVSLAMRWEAVSVNADFWSHVLQSRTLKPQDFALGAVMGLTRGRLAAIGGFRALVNHLADDYELGQRIARSGGRIELCPVVVECWDAPAGWGEVWSHQLRWSRTIRVCQPVPYFASILGNPTLWAAGLAATLAAGLTPPGAPGTVTALWGLVTASLGSRAAGALLLQRRLDGFTPPWWTAWLPWLKDLVGVGVWLAAFTGSTVVWRGIAYRVDREGRLTPLAS